MLSTSRSLLMMCVVSATGINCKPPARPAAVARPVSRPATPAAVPLKKSVAVTKNVLDEQSARKLLQEAQRFDAQKDAKAAENRRWMVLSKYPATQAAAELMAQRADAAMKTGKVAVAVSYYEQLLFNHPNMRNAAAVRERYASVLVNAQRPNDAISNYAMLYENAATAQEKNRLGLALAPLYQKVGRAPEALDTYLTLLNSDGVSPVQRAQISNQAVYLANSGLNDHDAEQAWQQHSNDSNWALVQPPLALRLAKIYRHARDDGKTSQMLNVLVTQFSDSTEAHEASTMLSQVQSQGQVDPRTIGVILPLSGKFKQYGERALQAIRLALGESTAINLVIKDSQGDANAASLAVEKLSVENHVMAIIGPVFSNEAMAAATKAEELGTPIITLSFREGITSAGPHVFRTALTVSAQARALAYTAFETLGFRTFAILYPQSRYGNDFVTAFWEEVDKRQGEIRGAEAYAPDQTTFREPVRRLVGKWFLQYRPDYRAAVSEVYKQKLPPMRQRSELQNIDKNLSPIVDFDAVVIPDSGTQIGLIAPALAFEDVVLSHDPRIIDRVRRATNNPEAKPITLLGASTWNNNQVLDNCESYCEDAVFVDAYYPNSSEPQVQKFVSAFHATVNAEPNLSDAQAYDTMGLVKLIVQTSNPSSREAMVDALIHAPPYNGVTGKFNFSSDRDAQRSLQVLTIKNHAIQPLAHQ